MLFHQNCYRKLGLIQSQNNHIYETNKKIEKFYQKMSYFSLVVGSVLFYLFIYFGFMCVERGRMQMGFYESCELTR